MKLFVNTFLLAAVAVLCSCRGDGTAGPEEGQVAVKVSVAADGGFVAGRALGDADAVRIDRILLLPFEKTGTGDDDDDSQYTPVYDDLAEQRSVAAFPASDLTLYLPEGRTYKLIVFGFGRDAFDLPADLGNGTGKFDLVSTTLADFGYTFRDALDTPELFVGRMTEASTGNEYFTPSRGTALTGDLQRVVAGISVSLTGIPDYVTRIEMGVLGLLSRTVYLDGSIDPNSLYRTNDPLLPLAGVTKGETPDTGTFDFAAFLPPKPAAGLDPGDADVLFYITVYYGSTSEQYGFRINGGSPPSYYSLLTLVANQAYNFSGDYATAINLGFLSAIDIGLDDDAWDGVTP